MEYLNKSQLKQWEILNMIRETQKNFDKKAKDYSNMGDGGINRPTCKKVSRAYKQCSDELDLILSVIETVH
jgi:hypothetical protein